MITNVFTSSIEGRIADNGTAAWGNGTARASEGGRGSYYYVAPAEYLGNLLAYFGGSLSYSLRIGSSLSEPNVNNGVVISGGGLTLYADTVVDAADVFRTFAVDLSAAGGSQTRQWGHGRRGLSRQGPRVAA